MMAKARHDGNSYSSEMEFPKSRVMAQGCESLKQVGSGRRARRFGLALVALFLVEPALATPRESQEHPSQFDIEVRQGADVVLSSSAVFISLRGDYLTELRVLRALAQAPARRLWYRVKGQEAFLRAPLPLTWGCSTSTPACVGRLGVEPSHHLLLTDAPQSADVKLIIPNSLSISRFDEVLSWHGSDHRELFALRRSQRTPSRLESLSRLLEPAERQARLRASSLVDAALANTSSGRAPAQETWATPWLRVGDFELQIPWPNRWRECQVVKGQDRMVECLSPEGGISLQARLQSSAAPADIKSLQGRSLASIAPDRLGKMTWSAAACRLEPAPALAWSCQARGQAASDPGAPVFLALLDSKPQRVEIQVRAASAVWESIAQQVMSIALARLQLRPFGVPIRLANPATPRPSRSMASAPRPSVETTSFPQVSYRLSLPPGFAFTGGERRADGFVDRYQSGKSLLQVISRNGGIRASEREAAAQSLADLLQRQLSLKILPDSVQIAPPSFTTAAPGVVLNGFGTRDGDDTMLMLISTFGPSDTLSLVLVSPFSGAGDAFQIFQAVAASLTRSGSP
jgi:hypothetical protein